MTPHVLRRTPFLPLALLLGTLGPTATAGGEPLGTGDRLEPLVLEDQHGEEHRIGPEVALVLFTRDMDAGDLSKQALADTTGLQLAERRAVYVADIHGMPALVARLFALPAMRRRPYPMLLDREGELTRDLPAREGEVTLLHLDGLEIARVEHLASAGAIREALGLEDPASDEER